MADDSMALLDTLRKAMADGDVDILREGVRVLAQAIMEAEVGELTGVPKGERDPERRLTSRNGYRERRWDTRVGSVELAIPRVRDGSYFPSLLEPRRRAERALLAVIQEAYVLGVSTRRVDDLVRTLGIASISRSEVSRICTALDAEVAAFRGRSLAGEAYPYLWLDATYLKVREGGRVVSMAALVATGVARNGERRILGLDLSAGNDEGSAWPRFIRSLVERGLHGVRLVISDDHAGLVKAVREQLLGSGWQRSSVQTGPGPTGPSSPRTESALAAMTHCGPTADPRLRPGGEAPTGPREMCFEHRTMSVPGGQRRRETEKPTAGGRTWMHSSDSTGVSSTTRSTLSTPGAGRRSRCGSRTIGPDSRR
jgi:hypothetical protein